MICYNFVEVGNKFYKKPKKGGKEEMSQFNYTCISMLNSVSRSWHITCLAFLFFLEYSKIFFSNYIVFHVHWSCMHSCHLEEKERRRNKRIVYLHVLSGQGWSMRRLHVLSGQGFLLGRPTKGGETLLINIFFI